MVYFEQIFFFNTFCIILVEIFFISFCILKNTKNGFLTQTSNTILVIFQMIVVFQKQFMYSHTYVCLNGKPCLNVKFFILTW